MERKPTKIGAPAQRRAALGEFFRAEGLNWPLVDSPDGRINIVDAPPGSECDLTTLHPGGRIRCSVALSMAEAFDLPSKTVGRLMNLLEIRIHDCQLGCFK